MESEKVKEIKKALECCCILTNSDLPLETRDNACNSCPYELEWCTHVLIKNALTLINELESENERLQLENRVLLGKEIVKNEMHENLVIGNINIQEQIKQENERLKNCIAELERKVYAKEDYYNAVKDRALEVFVNKLKENLDISVVGYSTEEVVTDIKNTIDETLKECLGK